MRITVTKNKLYWSYGYLLVQNPDCRLNNADRKQKGLGTKCRLQTAEWVQMQTENLKCFFFWYMIICHLTTYQSVTQSLFRDQPSRLLWNIPGPLFDQNSSEYNSKPSYSLLTLRASWLVLCLYRFYQLNKIRCKWDVTIAYLTRAIFEKQLRALHVVLIIIFLSDTYVFIFLTKMRTETKTWLSWIRYKASELLTPLKSIKFAYIDSKSRSKKILNLGMKFTTKSSDSAA